MIKLQAKIYFKEPFDEAGVDEIVEKFVEADYTYETKYARFRGTPERLQEFIRAVKTVVTVDKVTEL